MQLPYLTNREKKVEQHIWDWGSLRTEGLGEYSEQSGALIFFAEGGIV
jgi:hypothetical protein